MSEKKLTPRQEEFCHQYIVDLNGTQAAIRAGYAQGSAEVTASQLLRIPKVRQVIDELKAERQQRTQITADWVLEKIKATVERCEMEGEHNPLLKGCELLGRHLKMFTDKLEVEGEISISEGLRKARERARKGSQD